jgi:hypothetical protein
MVSNSQKTIDQIWNKYRVALKRLDRALDLLEPKVVDVEQQLDRDLGLDSIPKDTKRNVVTSPNVPDFDEYAGLTKEEINYRENQKRVWKAVNPDAQIKSIKYKKQVGYIDRLPWEDLILPTADNLDPGTGESGFGVNFPSFPNKGDTFLRVDQMPHQLYKWNDKKWIRVDKESNVSYTYNEDYIEHLIALISNGEFEPERLTQNEREAIAEHLKREQDK